MSKRRLVVTAVLAGRSQSEVARAYGVSQGWISRLVARYRAEGEAAFEPRSRAPKTSPGATAPATVDLVLVLRKQLSGAGLDAGADTIGWHLGHRHNPRISNTTTHRIPAGEPRPIGYSPSGLTPMKAAKSRTSRWVSYWRSRLM